MELIVNGVMVRCKDMDDRSILDSSAILRFHSSYKIHVRLFNSRAVWERRGSGGLTQG